MTADKAFLWTDGRYYLQAETELGAEWTLMRGGSGTCPEVGVCVGFMLKGYLRAVHGEDCARSQGVRDALGVGTTP